MLIKIDHFFASSLIGSNRFQQRELLDLGCGSSWLVRAAEPGPGTAGTAGMDSMDGMNGISGTAGTAGQ